MQPLAPLYENHMEISDDFYFSGIIVKRVPRTFEEETDDIQISSAITVFRDTLDQSVNSIVLVSVGTLVGC